MVPAGEALRPFPCRSEPGEASLPAPRPLTAGGLRAELAGHTFYSDPLHTFPIKGGHVTMFVATDGMVYGTLKAEPDLGRWHGDGRWRVTPDGQYCESWWSARGKGCFAVYREGEIFEFHAKGRFAKEVYRRVPGNPEGY